MHEKEFELKELNALLDESYRTAGKHLLSIHREEWRLSAAQIVETLVGVCVLNLASVDVRGAPLVAPVDGLFLGGRFWFGSAEGSRRFNHIRRDPRVSAAYTTGEEISITVSGIAHEIDTSTGEYERFHEYCREVYGPDYDDWGYWENSPFAWIEARRMYAIKMSGDVAAEALEDRI